MSPLPPHNAGSAIDSLEGRGQTSLCLVANGVQLSAPNADSVFSAGLSPQRAAIARYAQRI